MRANSGFGSVVIRVIAVVLAGCGREPASAPVPGHGPPRVVMVIDEGFDRTVSALEDKVLAAYTLVCAEAADGGAFDGGSSTGEGSSSGDGGADAGVPPF